MSQNDFTLAVVSDHSAADTDHADPLEAVKRARLPWAPPSPRSRRSSRPGSSMTSRACSSSSIGSPATPRRA